MRLILSHEVTNFNLFKRLIKQITVKQVKVLLDEAHMITDYRTTDRRYSVDYVTKTLV